MTRLRLFVLWLRWRWFAARWERAGVQLERLQNEFRRLTQDTIRLAPPSDTPDELAPYAENIGQSYAERAYVEASKPTDWN